MLKRYARLGRDDHGLTLLHHRMHRVAAFDPGVG